MQALLEDTMLYLSTTEEVTEPALLALGAKHLGVAAPLESTVALQKLPKQREESLRSMPQVAHADQLNEVVP